MCQLKLFLWRCIKFIVCVFVRLDSLADRRIAFICKQIYERKISHRTNDASGFHEKDPFYENISLISHAGGGLQGMAYLNCVEAFDVYYLKGNKVFEYDICVDENDNYICSHSSFKREIIDSRFTPITLDAVIRNLTAHDDVVIIFDCKFDNILDFAKYLNSIMDSETRERIIIQIIEESQINAVRSVYDFKMIYVCFRNSDFFQTANVCLKNNIHAVSVPFIRCNDAGLSKAFIENNISVYVYTVNTIQDYCWLSSKRIAGVFSDFLYGNDIQKIMRD